MCGRLAFVATLAACYSPSAQPGAPCGPGGACPANQACVAGICGGTEPLDDAPMLDDAATIDTTMVTTDAPLDAPGSVPWGTPFKFLSLETTGSGEQDPSLTSNQLTMVLSADAGAGDDDIYIATRNALTDTFVTAPLTAVNVPTLDDKSPEISADGMTLIFASNRSGAYEIYESTFSTSWSVPTVRTDLSSSGSDSDVAISPDGLTAAVLHAGNPSTIYVHKRASTSVAFGTGVAHTELNVTTNVASPSITNNGAILYLHAGGIRQLYRAVLGANDTYSTPALVTELNVASTRTASPFVVEGDNQLFYEIAGDIYEVKRP